eukprot:scaffold130215_cov28-Prasinocladus_malaysianus.AAC.1
MVPATGEVVEAKEVVDYGDDEQSEALGLALDAARQDPSSVMELFHELERQEEAREAASNLSEALT